MISISLLSGDRADAAPADADADDPRPARAASGRQVIAMSGDPDVR
jgi:hypothetical protein